MMYCVYLSKDNLGVGTMVGTDAVNFLLLMGIIQYRRSDASVTDTWGFSKDSFFYLLNSTMLIAFFSQGEFQWWFGLIWFLYFLMYVTFFQKSNEALRDKIYLMLGLKDEDDVFSCEENKKWLKRRNDIENLIQEGFLKLKDIEDENMTVIQRLEDEKLRKAIERKEGLLKIRINGKRVLMGFG